MILDQLAPCQGPRAKPVTGSVFLPLFAYFPCPAPLPSQQYPPSAAIPQQAPSLSSHCKMSDVPRQKPGTRVISHGVNSSQNTTSPQNFQGFSPRPDLEVQILAAPSPVSLAKDTWSWLESKGWVLNSEDSSVLKLADILLSAMISFKLLADASHAIQAVAFLLHAHTNETLAATVTNHIINKVIDKISNPLAKLSESINSTKSFLDATELLSLQDTVKQQAKLIKSLTDVQPLNPRGLSDADWPLLPSAGRPSSLQPVMEQAEYL